MRRNYILLVSVMLAAITATPAIAQDMDAPPQAPGGDTQSSCSQLAGRFRANCEEQARKAARKAKDNPSAAAASADSKKGTPGVSKADAELVNATNAAARAKMSANDFAGAAAEYQKGIDARPNNPAKHVLYAGLAVALRRQAVATFNSGTRPTPPAFGASNDAIRAFNAAAAAAQAERSAATMPILKRALEAAATAAAGADASTNKAADPAIGLELREIANIWYRLDMQGVLTTPRPSAELEATWLRRWLTATPAPSEADAAKYRIAVAAALTAKDHAAGLALADELQVRTAADVDTALGYAEIVAAAKTPVGDPHRAKALAGLATVEASVIDGGQRAELRKLKADLAAPN